MVDISFCKKRIGNILEETGNARSKSYKIVLFNNKVLCKTMEILDDVY